MRLMTRPPWHPHRGGPVDLCEEVLSYVPVGVHLIMIRGEVGGNDEPIQCLRGCSSDHDPRGFCWDDDANDMSDRDTPLAMLRGGYAGLVAALAADTGADIRTGVEVTAVERDAGGGPATLRLGGGAGSEQCDLVVLTGMLTRLVDDEPVPNP